MNVPVFLSQAGRIHSVCTAATVKKKKKEKKKKKKKRPSGRLPVEDCFILSQTGATFALNVK